MNDERFIPGEVLAGRYRVVECVGRGGMGEVYRAVDLKLGQPVALKFLNAELSREPRRLEGFLAEVRLARQVTHPNVGRVHDVGELDGLHFLSMEFIDGEDLASLLRRIGRLPADKAIEITREICAGLAAIHERGVLHRDLKPANVMIDGRGHARITDFGLAELQSLSTEHDTISGTPAYMAPECLIEGRSASVGSDLYSLGLVMYELFTGHGAFDAATPQQALRMRRESTPVSPSKIQSDLDTRVERAILRCLEKDPERRPASAFAVAMALPGGDLLAATIASGETPSPELVAAAHTGDQGLRPAVAWTLLATLVLGVSLVTWLSPRTRLVPALSLTEPPAEMAGRARAKLQELGVAVAAADHTFGYRFDESVIDQIATKDRSRTRWESLGQSDPPAVAFWYRESTQELMPANRWQRVTDTDPPWGAGTAGVTLGLDGRLLRLLGSSVPDSSVQASHTPAFRPAESPDPSARVTNLLQQIVRPALFLGVMFVGVWLARRNLRAGRGDMKRALRLATALMALRLAIWLLSGHHAGGAITEQIMTAIAWSLYDFAYAGIFYVAIEPYVRRLWPRMLTSWVRLMDGKLGDPQVGRDVLIGGVAGTLIAVAVAGHQAAPVLFGAPPGRPDNVGYIEHQLASLLGVTAQLGEILWLVRSNVILIMAFVVMLVTACVLLRKTRAAVVFTFLLFVPLGLPKGDLLALNVALALISTLAVLFMMMRFGLLAAGAGLLTHTTLQSAPLGMAMGSWAAVSTWVVLILVLGCGTYGFVRSLGGRPAVKDVLAE